MKKKKILITGAEGFIARNLSKYLVKKKFVVYGIGTKRFDKKKSTKHSYRKLINKRISLLNLKKNFKNIDIIIHCAGSGTVQLSNKENYEKNYLTTKSVLDFSIYQKKKPKVLFMSSYSIYGSSHSKPIKENSKLKPSSSYAITKKLSEDLLLRFSKKYNLEIKILRLASIYGNGLNKQLLFDACNKISQNKNIFFGTGNEVRDWIHIFDLCELVYKILNKKKDNNPIINCGSGKGHKVREVIKLIKKKFYSKKIIKFINQKKQNPKILISDIKIAKSYNWKPKIPFKKGILGYIKWYKQNND